MHQSLIVMPIFSAILKLGMTKTQLNTLISNLKKANLITKVTPWMVEGVGNGKSEVRYVGLKLDKDWLALFSPKDNILLKFVLIKQIAHLEVCLANTPPFYKFYSVYLRDSDKWETVLGELKRKLNKNKEEAINHQARIDNLWIKIQPHLKK